MATVPQVYPLWLAEVRGHDVYAGRVVAWQVPESATGAAVEVAQTGEAASGGTAADDANSGGAAAGGVASGGAAADGAALDGVAARGAAARGAAALGASATPIVAFTTPDGMLLETGPPHGPVVFLADSREEAVAAAYQVTAPPVAIPPLPEEVDEDDPRPPDPRTRTLSLRRLGADEVATRESSPATRHLHRHDR
jgi:hypothetical protein